MEGGGGAAMEVLVQNLIDVTKGEISLIRGLKKNAHKLQNSLTVIQSYLDDAEKKLITDEAVKTWLKQLDDVAFDAHNVLDELKYDDIKRNMKKIRREKRKNVGSILSEQNVGGIRCFYPEQNVVSSFFSAYKTCSQQTCPHTLIRQREF